MVLEYNAYKMVGVPIAETDNEIQQIFSAGELTLFCTLHFDTDKISDTFNKWICTLEVVSDELDVPERSLVLYPNTVHFEGDDLYTVTIQSSLEEIGHDDLQNVVIIIGVPADE